MVVTNLQTQYSNVHSNCDRMPIKFISFLFLFHSFAILYKKHQLGNGLMDEKEFRQWIQRIQSLQEDSGTPSTSQTDTDDDVTQDLIAAFRYGNKCIIFMV